MKKIGGVVLFLLLFGSTGPGSVSAQTVTDTIPILIIQGQLASVQAASVTGPFRVGDTIQFQAQAYDTQGDPVDAVYTWRQESTDSTNTIINQNDPAIQIDATTGVGVFLRKLYPGETLNVIVAAQQVDQLTLGWFRPAEGAGAIAFGDANVQCDFIDGTTTCVQPVDVQYCAYLLYRGSLVAQSASQPPIDACPFAFGAPADRQVDGFWQAPELWYKRGIEDLLHGLVNLGHKAGDWVS